MDPRLNDSILKVSSDVPAGSTSNAYGTGFIISRDSSAAYVLTCAHVVSRIGSGNVRVDEYSGELIAIGSETGIDLAVLRVNGLQDRTSFNLRALGTESQSVSVIGFKKQGKHFWLVPLEGYLGKRIILESEQTITPTRSNAWDLEFNGDLTLEEGYSGSPVIDESTGSVIGIVSYKYKGSRGVAIAIEEIAEIWPDIPTDLLSGIMQRDAGYMQLRKIITDFLQRFPLKTATDVNAAVTTGIENSFGSMWNSCSWTNALVQGTFFDKRVIAPTSGKELNLSSVANALCLKIAFMVQWEERFTYYAVGKHSDLNERSIKAEMNEYDHKKIATSVEYGSRLDVDQPIPNTYQVFECRHCSGLGLVDTKCDRCNGTGTVKDEEERTHPCDKCSGQGVVKTACSFCEGGLRGRHQRRARHVYPELYVLDLRAIENDLEAFKKVPTEMGFHVLDERSVTGKLFSDLPLDAEGVSTTAIFKYTGVKEELARRLQDRVIGSIAQQQTEEIEDVRCEDYRINRSKLTIQAAPIYKVSYDRIGSYTKGILKWKKEQSARVNGYIYLVGTTELAVYYQHEEAAD